MRTMGTVAVLAITAGVSAQEGTVTLPRNYQVQFENAWVKVTAVRYGPHEKLPGHTHTPNPSAYVVFELAEPGKDFALHSRTRLKRVKSLRSDRFLTNH